MASTRSQTLVSVLTPSFNQGAYLGDALGSVRSQTYGSIEHIVMDGGSTDATIDVLRSAGDSITWRSEPDRGQSHAINKAFAMSTGEIIGWINSDDALYDVCAVQDVVDFFERHPDVDVVYGHAARVTADGLIVRIMAVPHFSYRHLLWECFLVQPAVFIRRRALPDDWLVNEEFQFAMDWELWLRLGRYHRFARLNRVLAIDRTHGERKIKTWLPVLKQDTDRLVATYGAHRPKDGDLLQRYYAVASRLSGARHLFARRAPFAFTVKPESVWSALRRQVASRSSAWPDEYV